MHDHTPPEFPTANPGLARDMLRDAVMRVRAAERTVTYCAAVARDHGVPWPEVEEMTGLARPTLQRHIAAYREGSGADVGGGA